MGLPEIQNHNVSQYLNHEEIVLETIAQIMKDFGLFGLTIQFTGDLSEAYQELMRQLVEQVGTLIDRDYGRLLAVLYQVDISDREIKRTTLELPHYNQVEIIAHQIIVRDLKKVLTRRYFKEQGN